jgi:hypothetical protein
MIRKEIALKKTKPKNNIHDWKSKSGSELSNKSKICSMPIALT